MLDEICILFIYVHSESSLSMSAHSIMVAYKELKQWIKYTSLQAYIVEILISYVLCHTNAYGIS